MTGIRSGVRYGRLETVPKRTDTVEKAGDEHRPSNIDSRKRG